jgi:hypothetical protein
VVQIIDAPVIVWAACEQRGIPPEALEGFKVTADDVYLQLTSGAVWRVEISSLPADVQDLGPDPEVMRAMGPGPESVTVPVSTGMTGDDHGPTLYLPEISEAIHDILIKAGLGSIEALAAASDRELEALPGIGRATVKRIRGALAGLKV